MKQEKIIQGNKLIAEFMGNRFKPKSKWYNIFGYRCDVFINRRGVAFPLHAMRYHSSWDWIIPVIHLISTKYKIAYRGSNIQKQLATFNVFLVFGAVVEFIQWYNKRENELVGSIDLLRKCKA